MKITFFDRENNSNPLNGTTISDVGKLESVLESLRSREPFVCALQGENGYELTIGIAATSGSVQHCPSNGDPPYLMALGENEIATDEHVEFLMGGTPSEISTRYIISFEVLKQIAAEFLATGNRSNIVSWEEI